MENSEFDQSNTSEFNQNASQKISKVFISEFSGLGKIVQNGNSEAKNLGKIFSENSKFSTSPSKIRCLNFSLYKRARKKGHYFGCYSLLLIVYNFKISETGKLGSPQ